MSFWFAISIIFKYQVADIVLLYPINKFHCNCYYFELDMTFYVKARKQGNLKLLHSTVSKSASCNNSSWYECEIHLGADLLIQ